MDGRNNAAGGAGIMDKVKDGAVSQLNTQKDRATEGIGSVAQAVRQSTQQLRDGQHDTIAQYVEQAASQLDKFANTLRQRDAGELMQDAQRFARRNPALFIGSAFAAGLITARFFKSSRQNGSSDWQSRTNVDAIYGGSAQRGYATGTAVPSPIGTGGTAGTSRTGASTGTTSTPVTSRTSGTTGTTGTPGTSRAGGATSTPGTSRTSGTTGTTGTGTSFGDETGGTTG